MCTAYAEQDHTERGKTLQPKGTLMHQDMARQHLAFQPLLIGLAPVVRPQRRVAVALTPATAAAMRSGLALQNYPNLSPYTNDLHITVGRGPLSAHCHNQCHGQRYTKIHTTGLKVHFWRKRACAPPSPAACGTRTWACSRVFACRRPRWGHMRCGPLLTRLHAPHTKVHSTPVQKNWVHKKLRLWHHHKHALVQMGECCVANSSTLRQAEGWLQPDNFTYNKQGYH